MINIKLYYFDEIIAFEIENYIDILSEERKEKANRYKREIDKKQCIISFILLKKLLYDQYGIKEIPDFSYEEKNKPYFSRYPNIYFNLSHCKKGVVCAVSNVSIGVDIQEFDGFNKNIVERTFSENEKKLMLNANCKEREFTKIWSMKEAYLKKLGIGITVALNTIDTTLYNIKSFDFQDFIISASGDYVSSIERIMLRHL